MSPKTGFLYTSKSNMMFIILLNLVYFCFSVYIHGLATRGVHYFHRPRSILQDTSFFLLPELGQERAYVSETVFTFVFLCFFLVINDNTLYLVLDLHPFILKSKKIYIVLIWCRVLAFLVVSSNLYMRIYAVSQ
ncbi:hypothetical protein Hanom_Chr15g01381421 [Helianthus anomalus]